MRQDLPPVSIGYRVISSNPGHTTISVWIGRNPGARGSAGHLVVRADELDVLVAGWDEIE